MQQLSSRTAIITGAGRGIGAATARSLAEAGIDIVLAVRDIRAARKTADEVEAAGARALLIACDVGERLSVRSVVDQTLAHFGRIDILVNNAGQIEPIAVLGESDEGDWAQDIRVNLIGAYHCVRAVLPSMLERGGGTIVNLSSGAAHNALEGWSAYCAAKAGLAMLTRSIALEYGDKGIRVFGFAPGTTDTDMQGVIRASGINRISRLKRSDLVPVHEPASAIAYLCSAAANDLAGTELTLNDGALRRRMGMRVLEAG